MGDNPGLPPLLPRPGSGGGSVAISRYQPSLFGGDQGESMSIIGQDIFAAPELPEIVELLTRGIPSRTTIADMIGLCRTTVQDIERLPAIHPSVMSSRGEQNTRYMSFVSPPPIETRPPRGRVKYPRKLLGPEECYKCQLRTEHSNCEKHKFLRIGGGYRHSYAYIKQIMDAIAKEQYDIARVEFLKQEQIRIEEQRKIEQEKNKVKRRVKVFLRTKSGNVITRYQFFDEDDYREMKSDKALARKMLGLDDADSLEDFVASKDDYVLDEHGEMVKAKKKKRKKKGRHKSRDRDEETEDESADEVFDSDGDQDRRRHRREKKRRSKRHRRSRERSSDGVSESGVGASIVGDDRDSRSEKSKRRRRRHHHGSDEGNDVDDDVDGRRSVQSYISENGTHHEAIRHREKKRHRRRDDSREDRSRHHRRKRRDDGENAEGGESRLSDSASDEGEDGHGHHRDRRRHRHRVERRHGRRRDVSGDDGSDARGYDSKDDADSIDRGHRTRRDRRRHRRHGRSDHDGEEDGERRRHRRGSMSRRSHRNHRGRERKDDDGSSSDFSESDDGDRRGGHRGGRRHGHDRRKSKKIRSREHGKGSGSDVDDDSSLSPKAGRHHRRHRDRHGGSTSDRDNKHSRHRRSQESRDLGGDTKQRGSRQKFDIKFDKLDDDYDLDKKSRGHHRRHRASIDDDDDDQDDTYRRHRRRSERRHERRRERGGEGRSRSRKTGSRDGSDSYSSGESSYDSSSRSSSGTRSGRGRSRRRGSRSKSRGRSRRSRRNRGGDGSDDEGSGESGSSSGSSSYSGSTSYDSSYDSSRSHTSSDSDLSSSNSGSESSDGSLTSSSSEVSEVSDVSSIASDEISEVGSELQGEERLQAIQQKKEEMKEDRKAEKQLKKFQDRKKEREDAREEKRLEREKKKREKERMKEERAERQEERRRGKQRDGGSATTRHGKGSAGETESESERSGKSRRNRRERKKERDRLVSAVSSVGTIMSGEISPVDSALSDGEKKRVKEEKKEKLKQHKMEAKKQAKVEEHKQEMKLKRKEQERKRLKKEIAREMEEMSSASSASSIHSSDISDDDDVEGLDEATRLKRRASKKRKMMRGKQKSKNMMKAMAKVMEKRKIQGRDDPLLSDDDGNDGGMADLSGKKDFKTMVNYSKGSKRGLTDKISKSDNRGMEWMTEWKLLKEKQARKEQMKLKKKEEQQKQHDPLAEFRTIIKAQGPDPLPDKVSKLRLFIGRNIDIMKGSTVRVKQDGTVAADDDSDAETVHIDEDGNLLNIPLSLQDGEDSDLREWNTDASMTRLSTPMDLTSEDDTAEAVGVRKVLKEFRRHPKEMGQHLKRVMETANELQTEDQKRASLRVNSARAVDERETTINYMNHYRLVEKTKLEPMARAFVVEDRERACVLTLQAMRDALNGVPSLSKLQTKQLEYVLKVLDVDDHSRITFKMFAVIGAICERVTAMDALGQELLDHSDLLDIQRKMDLYSSMFYCSGTNGDRNDNFINKDSLRIELKAGGLNRTQEEYVIEKMNADEHNKISFLDYMAYIPLFLSMHDNIIDNPLDFAEKYNKPSTEIQRDMNPIGLPLKRTYHALHQNLMCARRNNSGTSRNTAKQTAKELSSTKLPNIMNRMTGLKIHQATPGSATKRPKP